LKNFDWARFAGDDIVVVATPPLVRELAKLKNSSRTRDREPHISAKRFQVRAIEPPQAARLPTAETEEQAELQKLRNALSILENRLLA